MKIHQDSAVSFVDTTLYIKLIGKLLDLTNNRPDITLSVQQLSQLVNSPTVTHFNATCRVLKYLKETVGHGCSFQGTQFYRFLGS